MLALGRSHSRLKCRLEFFLQCQDCSQITAGTFRIVLVGCEAKRVPGRTVQLRRSKRKANWQFPLRANRGPLISTPPGDELYRVFRDSNPKKVQPVIDRSGFAIYNLHGKKFLPIHTRMHFLLGEAPSNELRILDVL